MRIPAVQVTSRAPGPELSPAHGRWSALAPSRPRGSFAALPFLLCLGLGLGLGLGVAGCQMHRWVYVRIESAPAGAKVTSKGLPGPYEVSSRSAPVGQLLPCTPLGEKPAVLVPVTHWSYLLKKRGYNDEELFVERSALTAFCADTRDEARARPFRLLGKMASITTERGLKNTVSITSDPPGASIYDVGTQELLGKTPAKITFTFFAPYKVGRLIELRLSGYQSARRLVQVRSINLSVKMLRPGETPRPDAQDAPPPKKRRTPDSPSKAPAQPPRAP